MSGQKESNSTFFYFESSTMRGLYDSLETWQKTNQKRILSLSIQQDHENFCCIVLSDSRRLPHTPLTAYKDAMEKFQRKALKHIGVGVDFFTYDIEPEKIQAIQMKLVQCKTPTEVNAVFFEAYSND